MLFLIRGLPGSGKTTLAEQLDSVGFVDEIVAADDFMVDEEGNYVFVPSRLSHAHEMCLNLTRIFLTEGLRVAVHNTFTTEKEMAPYFELAEELGVQITTLVVENRHGSKSVHGVPEHTLERMARRFSLKVH